MLGEFWLFSRYAFERIVFKMKALVIGIHNSFFSAQNGHAVGSHSTDNANATFFFYVLRHFHY